MNIRATFPILTDHHDRNFESFKHSSLDTHDNMLLLERNYNMAENEELSEGDEFGFVEHFSSDLPENPSTKKGSNNGPKEFRLSGPTADSFPVLQMTTINYRQLSP
jgi:hypothetical protein